MLQDKNIQIFKYSNIQYSAKNYNRIRKLQETKGIQIFCVSKKGSKGTEGILHRVSIRRRIFPQYLFHGIIDEAVTRDKYFRGLSLSLS